MASVPPFQIVGPGRQQQAAEKRPSLWRRLRRYPLISILLLIGIGCSCLLAPWLANHDPSQFYLSHLNQQPDETFYFGTDSLGRDIFSIIWYGGRVSLLVGFLSMLVSTGIGVLYGCISGTASGISDHILMRLAELISSIPSILLMLLLLAFIPKPGIISLSLVIGATSWMNLARVVRSEVRQIGGSEYVLASRSMGGGFLHIVRYHLVPNIWSPIMFMVVSSMGTAMTTEATLSFLGLGLPADVVSWGTMLSLAGRALLTNSWWVILIPGVFLVVTLVSITRIGHFLRSEVRRGCSNL